LQSKIFKINISTLTLAQYQQAGGLLINEGKNILITFLSAKSVINGDISLGAMLAIQQIIGQLNAPMEQIIGFTHQLQDTRISLERLNEIHEIDDEEIGHTPINKEYYANDLCINNVTFKYPGAGSTPVIQDLTLTVLNGKTTAIVGSSGSGKTTLLKLLLKFYHPDKGTINLGNKDIQNISHKQWRMISGVVMQDGFIFSDTIASNIAIGEEEIDKDKLIEALTISNLIEYIDSLPSGINTIIGAQGNGLSQGQKQRVLIARAVYKQPRFLFFDEATNSLDTNNERVIVNNLTKFFKDRTVVVVAHRLSTVMNADQIVVMDGGRIVEIGTNESLIKLRGKYYELIKNQLELGS
jgi:ATP-binding cassette subfamily B protein